MLISKLAFQIKSALTLAIVSTLFFSFSTKQIVAQKHSETLVSAGQAKKSSPVSSEDFEKYFSLEKDFRIEKIPVEGGAEIITIFANLKGMRNSPGEKAEEIPLVSVLRDTLGDQKIENDRLRYVWMLTYTNPSMMQKAAAGVPFLYSRTTNKKEAGNGLPPSIVDLNPSKKAIWDRAFWLVFRNLIINDFTMPLRAATLQYRENRVNYRRVSIARALAVLSVYEAIERKKVLTDAELRDIQAGLALSDKFFGSLMKKENLKRVYNTNQDSRTAMRARNWELLRQHSESQGLYFEPLQLPNGDATHAIVWLSLGDIEKNKNKPFESRFLNIKNPWQDARLNDWKGYSEVRWFDEKNYPVAPETPNAKPRTMIPLALYGLDYPKIPVVLIDFRDQNNPKMREMSRRVLTDITRNVLSISRFSNLPYFVGHYVYDFVMARRGIDMNQASRLNSYSQLKLLLALDASLEPDFRNEIADRLETVSLNPLENDLDVEIKLAKQQYENLVQYAKNPHGLPAQLSRERREEMMRIKHTNRQLMLYTLARVLSFGVYKHREKVTPELLAEMDIRRQLDYHERYLREVAQLTVKPEIDSDVQAINRSLAFVAENGNTAGGKTAKAVAKIFAATERENLRVLALESLYKINNKTAKKELLAIYQDKKIDVRWRNISARYLQKAAEENQNIPAVNLKAIVEFDEK